MTEGEQNGVRSAKGPAETSNAKIKKNKNPDAEQWQIPSVPKSIEITAFTEGFIVKTF